MSNAPLMPKATAIWLVENTSLTFDQVAQFCKLHPLEVKGIADGEVGAGIRGHDPITSGQLTHAPQRLRRAVAIVVGGHDVVTGLKQGEDGVRADIAGTAGNKNSHGAIIGLRGDHLSLPASHSRCVPVGTQLTWRGGLRSDQRRTHGNAATYAADIAGTAGDENRGFAFRKT